jgi:hypothetical protein
MRSRPHRAIGCAGRVVTGNLYGMRHGLYLPTEGGLASVEVTWSWHKR